MVLDAKSGDLLSSAMYPLPDQNRLLSMPESELLQYADISRDEEWTAYSDMDLGLLFPSQPGSTAKVMSSMAMPEFSASAISTMDFSPIP